MQTGLFTNLQILKKEQHHLLAFKILTMDLLFSSQYRRQKLTRSSRAGLSRWISRIKNSTEALEQLFYAL